VGPLDGLDHPAAEGQVGTEPSTVGEHPGHRSGRLAGAGSFDRSSTVAW
jgi:hypothetical protein